VCTLPEQSGNSPTTIVGLASALDDCDILAACAVFIVVADVREPLSRLLPEPDDVVASLTLKRFDSLFAG
jgi:hypothetical protein